MDGLRVDVWTTPVNSTVARSSAWPDTKLWKANEPDMTKSRTDGTITTLEKDQNHTLRTIY